MRRGRQITKEKMERLKKVIRDNPELLKPVLAKRFGISTTTVAKAQAVVKEEQQNG